MNVFDTEDATIHLGRIIGEIGYHNLGGEFMDALIEVIFGTEGLAKHQTKGLNGDELWQLSHSTAAQRIQACEKMLGIHGIKL